MYALKALGFWVLMLTALILAEGCENLPGIIGGAKGESDWTLTVDLAVIDPVSIQFKGKRKSEQGDETVGSTEADEEEAEVSEPENGVRGDNLRQPEGGEPVR